MKYVGSRNVKIAREKCFQATANFTCVVLHGHLEYSPRYLLTQFKATYAPLLRYLHFHVASLKIRKGSRYNTSNKFFEIFIANFHHNSYKHIFNII